MIAAREITTTPVATRGLAWTSLAMSTTNVRASVFKDRKNVFTTCRLATKRSEVSTKSLYCSMRISNSPGSSDVRPRKTTSSGFLSSPSTIARPRGRMLRSRKERSSGTRQRFYRVSRQDFRYAYGTARQVGCHDMLAKLQTAVDLPFYRLALVRRGTDQTDEYGGLVDLPVAIVFPVFLVAVDGMVQELDLGMPGLDLVSKRIGQHLVLRRETQEGAQGWRRGLRSGFVWFHEFGDGWDAVDTATRPSPRQRGVRTQDAPLPVFDFIWNLPMCSLPTTHAVSTACCGASERSEALAVTGPMPRVCDIRHSGCGTFARRDPA